MVEMVGAFALNFFQRKVPRDNFPGRRPQRRHERFVGIGSKIERSKRLPIHFDIDLVGRKPDLPGERQDQEQKEQAWRGTHVVHSIRKPEA